jgi:hypothetical protein
MIALLLESLQKHRQHLCRLLLHVMEKDNTPPACLSRPMSNFSSTCGFIRFQSDAQRSAPNMATLCASSQALVAGVSAKPGNRKSGLRCRTSVRQPPSFLRLTIRDANVRTADRFSLAESEGSRLLCQDDDARRQTPLDLPTYIGLPKPQRRRDRTRASFCRPDRNLDH